MKSNLQIRVTTLFLGIITLSIACYAGSLTVGTKVIYPGGADQPPQEKDTGVSLKGSAIGHGGASGQAVSRDTESPEALEEAGDYEGILVSCSKSSDLNSRAWVAIAMWYIGSESEAQRNAAALIKEEGLSEEMKDKLTYELFLDQLEDEETNE